MLRHLFIRMLVFLSLFTITLLSVPSQSLAQAEASATITVNSTANIIKAGDGKCTLREAIRNANANADLTAGDCARGRGADTIVLGKKQKYTLAVIDNRVVGQGGIGLPQISSPITIQGNGSLITRSPDARPFRIFWVEHNRLTLNDLRLANGDADTNPGGAVFMNQGTLTLRNCSLNNNQAESGGAIWNGSGTLTVVNCNVLNNEAEYGGAIRTEGGVGNANTLIHHSTFEHNTATGQGGALYDRGTLSIAYTTFLTNQAPNGGALYLYQDQATVTASTFTLNNAEQGSASSNDSSQVTFTNVTIAGNTTTSGGALFTQVGATGLANTIIANQLSGQNCSVASGTLNDNGGNLRFPSSDTSCVGTFGDPKLGPLAKNGGPTQTMYPQSGSAAIDGGNNLYCAPIAGNPVLDQRGLTRPQDSDGNGSSICDIGAVEVAASAPAVPVLLAPPNGLVIYHPGVTLSWEPTNSTTQYYVQVRSGSKTGPIAFSMENIYAYQNVDVTSDIEIVIPSLPTGVTYFWNVIAYNEKGSTPSVWRKFKQR